MSYDDDIRKYYENKQLKNSGVAIVFAIILGFLGLLGIGHIYIGKTRKGIGYLISGLIVIPICLSTTVIFSWMVIFIGIFIYFIVFIHQILSVRDYCNKFNEYFIRTKRQLW